MPPPAPHIFPLTKEKWLTTNFDYRISLTVSVKLIVNSFIGESRTI